VTSKERDDAALMELTALAKDAGLCELASLDAVVAECMMPSNPSTEPLLASRLPLGAVK
jgi:hypothetical protein